jgi:hypothetical protein
MAETAAMAVEAAMAMVTAVAALAAAMACGDGGHSGGQRRQPLWRIRGGCVY